MRIHKFLSLALALLFLGMGSIAIAQTSKGFNYQAVLRNDDGSLMKEQAVNLQLSIRQGGPEGEIIYQEGHTSNTSSFGMVSMEVGKGIATQGSLDNIQWGKQELWLDVALDLEQDHHYKSLGASKIMSVPHAIQADKANDVAEEVKQQLRDTRWFEEAGEPTSATQLGQQPGDFYLDIASAKVYSFQENGTWRYRGNFGTVEGLEEGGTRSDPNDWTTSGNAGTTAGTNFVGTTDNQGLVFKTNSNEVGRFQTDGRMEIGGSNLGVGGRLTIKGVTGVNYEEGIRILPYNLNRGMRLWVGDNIAVIGTEGNLKFGIKNKNTYMMQLTTGGYSNMANQVSIVPLWQAGSNYNMANTSGADLSNCEAGLDPTVYNESGDIEVRLVVRITSTTAGTNNFQLRAHDGTTETFPIVNTDTWTFASTQTGIVAISQWKDFAAGVNAHEIHLFGWVDAGSTNFNSAYLMVRADRD